MSRRHPTIALLALPFLAAMPVAQDQAKPARPATLIQPASASGAQQQEPTQEELQKKFDEKLAKPFMSHAKWTVDYDAVRARAKAEKKLVLAYFTRSYSY